MVDVANDEKLAPPPLSLVVIELKLKGGREEA